MKNVLTALLKVQQEIGSLVKQETNPFFKSKYFDINSLLEHSTPILNKHGLVVLQPIKDGKVVTEIYHAESGEMLSSELELTNQNDPQKIGSEVTYFRRYTLGALLSIQAEDDDGNGASGKNKPKPKQTPQPKQLPAMDEETFNRALESKNPVKAYSYAINTYTLTEAQKEALEKRMEI